MLEQQIEKATQLKVELDQLRPLEKEKEMRIMQKFRLDWNYHSNNIEGNSLTYGETEMLLMHGVTAQGKPIKDYVEILGHDEAVKWILSVVKKDYPLTETFIRELHELILKESYEIDAITPDGQPTKKTVQIGKYKTTPNHVLTKTQEIFRFATPEETPALMQDLISWFREKQASKDVNPILLAAEFHYKFIRIHPFDDGNGRVARILMNFILMQCDYPPAIVKTEDKENYYFVLRQADAGSIEPFMEYIAKRVIASLEIMIAGAKGETIEEPNDLDKEIALLEQKVKSIGKKITIPKTLESVLEIYDKSIVPLAISFIQACEKFDKFYIQTEFSVYVDGSGALDKNKYDMVSVGRSKIKESSSDVKLVYHFIGFKQTGFDEFRYESSLLIEFRLGQYYIKDQLKVEPIIEKLYGEQLTDAEITEIVKIETRKHKDYIENKLKEVQDKKKN